MPEERVFVSESTAMILRLNQSFAGRTGNREVRILRRSGSVTPRNDILLSIRQAEGANRLPQTNSSLHIIFRVYPLSKQVATRKTVFSDRELKIVVVWQVLLREK